MFRAGAVDEPVVVVTGGTVVVGDGGVVVVVVGIVVVVVDGARVVVVGGSVAVVGTVFDVVVEGRVVVVVVAGADGPQAEASTIIEISQVDRRGLINGDVPLRLAVPTGEIDPTTAPESHQQIR